MKTKILILAIIACCGCGFFVWFRTLRPAAVTAGQFPMTLTGFNAEAIGSGPGGLGGAPPLRVDVYGTKVPKGKCGYSYLVAKNLLLIEANIGNPNTATVVVNPLQALQLRLAQNEHPLILALSRPLDDDHKMEPPKFTLEEFLGEVEAPP